MTRTRIRMTMTTMMAVVEAKAGRTTAEMMMMIAMGELDRPGKMKTKKREARSMKMAIPLRKKREPNLRQLPMMMMKTRTSLVMRKRKTTLR